MTWKDKPALGLKEDAPAPESPEIPATRENPIAAPAELGARPASSKPYRIVPVRSAPPKDKV